MKKLASVVTSIFIIIITSFNSVSLSAAPDLTKYAWPPNYNIGNYGQQPLLGYSFALVDDFMQNNTGEGFSFIRTTTSQRFCKDFKDPQCIKEIESGSSFWVNQVLPPCENTIDLINCIEEVNLIDLEGREEKLVMEKLIPGNTWPADTSPKVEAGSSSSRWVSKSEKNGEKGYKVTVAGGLGLTMSSRTEVSSARLSSFQASVEPYEKISGSFNPPKISESPDGYRSFGGNVPKYCLWVDTTECGVQTEFPEGTRIELVLHLPNEISGWILGRVNQPNFSTKRLGLSRISGQSLSRFTLSAFPVKVPMFSAKVDIASASPELNDYYQENKYCKEKKPECTGYFGGNLAGSYFDFTYKLFQLFEKNFNETANLVVPRWSIRSLGQNDTDYDRCRNPSTALINGIVTTNSSIYQGSPPKFNGESFIYKVASLHYLPNKEVFKGTYDLVLNSDFARCLYGFSNSPIQASVQVTNESGINQLVTNTFTEKDGWLKLSINGFTFSQPTINLQLSQEKVNSPQIPSPIKTPQMSPSTMSINKSTINCIKGKVVKKISSVSPKCPAGYKKK